MKYDKAVKAEFINRPNRFIAEVLLDGKPETVHVKNTGRCSELLVPGCEVYLAEGSSPARKTKYDLIAAFKERSPLAGILINLDSQAPNDAAEEWLKRSNLFSENAMIRREVTRGDSRFDFYIEDGKRKAFLEVKGVTQEYDGIAMFPDAPTLRGVKHINELIKCVEDGFEAYLLFIIQMKGISKLIPNDNTHPQFGEALREAEKSGVKIIAVDCIITPDSMTADSPVPVDLKQNK